MDDGEYASIERELNNIFVIRNNLLTFSFTIILAFLGVAFTGKADNMPIVYILPYFIIIPFTGRITYYRTEEARLLVLLNIYKKNTIIMNYRNIVKDNETIVEKMIAFLVNYEMLFLSLACGLLCIFKYPKVISEFLLQDYVYFILIAVFNMFELIFISSAFNYEKMLNRYKLKWFDHQIQS